jgi:hypothetical protein
MLVGLGCAAMLSMAACTAGKPAGRAGQSRTVPPAASATHAATPRASLPSATPGAASAAAAPPASAWLAAAEIPFGATYNWSLDTGSANSVPIGTAEGNGVYYVSPDTVFQEITSCGSPSLLLGTSVAAWQRLFNPTTGALLDQAGQWVVSYPDATAAQAAWRGLQAAYAGCLAQEGVPQITLTETAQTQDAMAWFHSTNGDMVGSIAPYAHEYFVLHENQIAYLFVEGAGPALATAPDDAQVLATIEAHLNA